MAQNPRNVAAHPSEFNSLFSTKPSTSSGVPSLLDYRGMPQHSVQGRPPTYTINQQYGRPAPKPFTPTQFANSVGLQPEIEGYGVLTWLSARAGVMVTLNDGKTVSFQEKEFCYKGIPDLRDVLRVGFILQFRATLAAQQSNQYIASSVLPIVGPQADVIFKDAHEIDLDPSLSKEKHLSPRYSKNLEYDVYSIVMRSFAYARSDTVQWRNILTEITNFGNDEVLMYVGKSIQRQKMFMEQRAHLFQTTHDTVTLQHPAIYVAIVKLTSFLLRRGGLTSISDLYDFFCNNMEPWIGDYIGHAHSDFTKFLKSQPFAFATFAIFVSARRNFPDFDYLGFIQTYFPTKFRPEERHEKVHYHQQSSHHHNEMRMYQQSMVMAHQSVPRHPVSTYTPHGSSSSSSASSQRTGSIFGGDAHFREQHRQEPPLNYPVTSSILGPSFNIPHTRIMEPVRPEPLKLPDNFPAIPEILAMGDKVMRGFNLPEVTMEPSSQKEYDELCTEFETYLQVVQAKESSSTRIRHPNCTCKCTCGFMKPGNNN